MTNEPHAMKDQQASAKLHAQKALAARERLMEHRDRFESIVSGLVGPMSAQEFEWLQTGLNLEEPYSRQDPRLATVIVTKCLESDRNFHVLKEAARRMFQRVGSSAGTEVDRAEFQRRADLWMETLCRVVDAYKSERS